MPTCSYINVCNKFFPAVQAFGSISKHIHCTKSQPLLQHPDPAKVDQLKRTMLSNSLWTTGSLDSHSIT